MRKGEREMPLLEDDSVTGCTEVTTVKTHTCHQMLYHEEPDKTLCPHQRELRPKGHFLRDKPDVP